MSGRKSWRETPVAASAANTLSAGIRLCHLVIACGVTPSVCAKRRRDPAASMSSSKGDFMQGTYTTG